MCAATAANTIPPPASVATLGVSPNASHTQTGASGASSAPSKAVSIGGRNFEPSVKRAIPSAEFTSPNNASSTRSWPETPKAWENGSAMPTLANAESWRLPWWECRYICAQ